MLGLINVSVILPDGILEDGFVLMEAGRITAVGPREELQLPVDTAVIDGQKGYVAPGFIDLQFNGAFGHDFTQSPETIWPVAARLPQFGVTSFLPTIITSPLETIQSAQNTMQQRPSSFKGANPLGLHLEGPFLNPEKKGAHNTNYMQLPNLEAAADWSPENQVRLVTLAPERPSALELISALADRGVVVSAGHSLATFAEAKAGFEAGIRYGTHLFNAMPAIHHREPGLVGALLDDERITIGIIPDGLHVHPALIKTVWQAAGSRVNIVTDAMAALGKPPGVYALGDYLVTVDETSARLPDGTLAGAVLSLDTAVRNLIEFTGCSLPEAVNAVTILPAKLLGLEAQIGQIAPHHQADLVLLTPDLQVAKTIVNGEIVYETEQ